MSKKQKPVISESIQFNAEVLKMFERIMRRLDELEAKFEHVQALKPVLRVPPPDNIKYGTNKWIEEEIAEYNHRPLYEITGNDERVRFTNKFPTETEITNTTATNIVDLKAEPVKDEFLQAVKGILNVRRLPETEVDKK